MILPATIADLIRQNSDKGIYEIVSQVEYLYPDLQRYWKFIPYIERIQYAPIFGFPLTLILRDLEKVLTRDQIIQILESSGL